MAATEFITVLRAALKPYVSAPSKLTAQQCLLRAASFRLLTAEQFENAKTLHSSAAKQRNVNPSAVLDRVAPKAAGFGHAMRGNAASPYGRIAKALENLNKCHLLKIGECNTSQKCSCCHAQLKTISGERFQGGALQWVEIYGIKVCNHCVTTWDRDLNAARNILAIFLTLRGGEPRPHAFRPQSARRGAAVEG